MEVLRTAAEQGPTRPLAPDCGKYPLKATEGGSESSNRGRIRWSLRDWVKFALRDLGQKPMAHHQLLLEELERLSCGETDRLMVLMPPGSAKSTYVSILLPPWWFTRHPRHSIIATAHTARLATYFARRTRRVIAENSGTLGYSITPDMRAGINWATTSGGEYYAVGVKGAIVGRRADLAILDDPIRSQADADSAHLRDGVWDWYRSDLTTRLKPNARIVLIMTRWHEDDVGGRLLDQAPAEWRVLRLPALAEDTDPLGRSMNAPLWPEWENLCALQRKRTLLGERKWVALFQQRPRPDAGSLFQVDRFEFIDAPPDAMSAVVVRAWDLASTIATNGADPDWTSGVKLMRDEAGRYTVLDVIRIRGTSRGVEDTIIAAARSDGAKVVISLPKDPGQAGESQVSYLTTRLAGYQVTSKRETGSKATRAMPVASQVEAGNVALIRSAWNRAFIEELRDFPYGRKDDQVDAFAHAFSALIDVGHKARGLSLTLMER